MRIILLACVLAVAAVNFSLACECGMEGSAGRIYKGSKVRAHKYPWIAHIRTYDDRLLGSFAECGGSLIDETHIATAAHCVVSDDEITPVDVSTVDVFLGSVNALTEENDAQSVSEIWVDPKFVARRLENDFAILTLSKPVKFTQTVSSVCLPTSEDGLSKLTVSGWGTTSYGSDASDNLLDVDVSYLTKDECNYIKENYYLKKFDATEDMRDSVAAKVADSHMCAINKKTRGDACAGDSGGPLMHKSDDGLYYLMGVVSGSWTECGQSEDSAGLYTRIAYYQDIIKSKAPNACWKSY